jgi:hypothetical protein
MLICLFSFVALCYSRYRGDMSKSSTCLCSRKVDDLGRGMPADGRASRGTCSAAPTNSIQEIVDLGHSELPNIDPREARRDPHSFEKEFALVVAHRRLLGTALCDSGVPAARGRLWRMRLTSHGDLAASPTESPRVPPVAKCFLAPRFGFATSAAPPHCLFGNVGRAALITSKIEGLMVLIGPKRIVHKELNGLEDEAIRQTQKLALDDLD